MTLSSGNVEINMFKWKFYISDLKIESILFCNLCSIYVRIRRY
jgi:hypothetical protein